MRYFVRCKYNGTPFHGWQAQGTNVRTVQEEIERVIKILTRKKVEVVGCGRTDTGVHAADYVFHMDLEWDAIDDLFYKMNRIVDKNIYFKSIEEVDAELHARFDAVSRSYFYRLSADRDPFRHKTLTYYPQAGKLEIEKLNEVADLIIKYDEFTPFCKAGTQVKTKKCNITYCQWRRDGGDIVFDISANRFLRGMIRLIVGVSIFVAEGKLDIVDVKKALDSQTRIINDWSVPPEGLFLDKILY